MELNIQGHSVYVHQQSLLATSVCCMRLNTVYIARLARGLYVMIDKWVAQILLVVQHKCFSKGRRI